MLFNFIKNHKNVVNIIGFTWIVVTKKHIRENMWIRELENITGFRIMVMIF